MFDLFKEKSVERNETFVDVFINNALKYPDKIALVDEEGSYTYHELNQISNGVAAKLLEQGIGKGDIVPILMKRGKGFVAAFIGVLKSGAAFAPIDINFPSERIINICESVSAKLAIDDKWMTDLPQHIEDINISDREEIAMLIYTSGSSNSPKGVVHTNNSLLAISKSVPKSISARYASIAPFTAISGMMGCLGHLYSGTSLYIVPERVRKDVSLLADWIRTFKITGFGCTTSVGKLLVDEIELEDVKWILLGGERIDSINNKKHISLGFLYGNSECGTCTCLITRGSAIMPPVGKPLPGIKVYIIDEDGMLVPSGNTGELCIAGPQVAKGYWKMPKLTAEKFVHCPFLPGDVTMYKTGDLARYRKDGNIELVGRKDFQIKIRGYRIEPGEIENVAMRFEGIDAVVVVDKEIGKERRLVLYYSSGAELEEDKLKEYLSRFLADYMVPNFYVHLDEMPRNANGKIDRSALPVPPLAIDNLPSKEQITRIEHSLLDEIKKELHLQDLGLDDDLLSLGFTSLSSMFVQTRLEQKGINFSSGGIEAYKVFLEFRTIRKVAKYLENDNN